MFLDAIVTSVDERVERLRPSSNALLQAAQKRDPVRSLKSALTRYPEGLAIIAECKQKSPSKGWLTENYDPVRQAKEYQRDGASAISVLTEPDFFAGSLAHLEAVTAGVGIPVLRKDFVRDPVQLIEARAQGADAALLIVRIVDDARLKELFETACELGLEVVVEIHSAHEAERAMGLGPAIVGVNNRDLDSFETRLSFSKDMSTLLDPGIVRVSESGIQSIEDLEQVQAWGYSAVLVGESLMRGSGLLRTWAHANHR